MAGPRPVRAPFFFPPGQGPGERARMDRHVEAAPHGVRHAGPGRRLVLGPPLRDEVQDRVGAFVGALGPARPGQQSGQPPGGEGRVRHIEGLATRPEGRGHGRDGPPVDAMAAQHLVLHLHADPGDRRTHAGRRPRPARARGADGARPPRAAPRLWRPPAGGGGRGRHGVTVIMYHPLPSLPRLFSRKPARMLAISSRRRGWRRGLGHGLIVDEIDRDTQDEIRLTPLSLAPRPSRGSAATSVASARRSSTRK